MNEKEFLYNFFDLKEIREKQISDIFSVLLKSENKINDYEKQNTFDKLLIDNLLINSIVISVSAFQGFIEDLILLFENYIIKENIEINLLNKKVYDLFYQKYSNEIIRDYLIYGEKKKVGDLGEFITKNEFGNIKLKKGTSNTLSFLNIEEMLNIMLIDFLQIIENINISISDYEFILDKEFGKRFVIKKEGKINFFKLFIDKRTKNRHEIVHGKYNKIGNKKDIFNLFLIVKKYLFDKGLLEIESCLKKHIREGMFYKK